MWLEQIALKLKLNLKKGKYVSTHKLTEAREEDIRWGIKYLDKAKDSQEEERWLDEMVLRLGINQDKWGLENYNSLRIGLHDEGTQEINRTSVK